MSYRICGAKYKMKMQGPYSKVRGKILWKALIQNTFSNCHVFDVMIFKFILQNVDHSNILGQEWFSQISRNFGLWFRPLCTPAPTRFPEGQPEVQCLTQGHENQAKCLCFTFRSTVITPNTESKAHFALRLCHKISWNYLCRYLVLVLFLSSNTS